MSVLLSGSVLAVLWLASASSIAGQGAAALDCERPEEARAGELLQLRCVASPRSRAVAVVLYHRPAGQEEFAPHPSLRTERGRYLITVPGCWVHPGTLHFYVEARDADDRVVGQSGDPESPHLLVIRGAPGPVLALATPAPRGRLVLDEDPLAAAGASRQAEREAAARAGVRAPGRPFVGFGAGYGYGYYPASRLDFRRDVEIAANTGAAGRVLLTPELGYQLSPRFALGLQLYWQHLGADGAGDAQMGSPATRSLTLLGRGSYYVGRGRTQLVASALIGGGDGLLLVVPPLPQQGLRRNDSVRAGPLVLGPGLGVLFHLHQHAALLLETRLLAGVPRLGAVADARLGAEVAF